MSKQLIGYRGNSTEPFIELYWSDGSRGRIHATDIYLKSFIQTYMDIIPQLTIAEHLDIICKRSATIPSNIFPARANPMQFTLSYVNLPHKTVDLDKYFNTMEELQEFISYQYQNYISYQVVVTAPKRKG